MNKVKCLFCLLVVFTFSVCILISPLCAQTPESQAEDIIDGTIDGVSSGSLRFLLGPEHAGKLRGSLLDLRHNLDRSDSEAIRRFVEVHRETDRIGLSERQAHQIHDAYGKLSSVLAIPSASPGDLLADHILASVKGQIFDWVVDFTYTQYNRLERQYIDERNTAEALLGQDRRGTYDSALKRSNTMTFEFQRVGGEIRNLNTVCASPRPEVGIDVVNPPYGSPRVVVVSKAYDQQAVSRIGFVIMENNLDRNYGRVLFMQIEDGGFVDTSEDQIASYRIDRSIYDSIANVRDLILRVSIEWGNGAQSACLAPATGGSERSYGPEHRYAPGDGYEYFVTVEEYDVNDDIPALLEGKFGDNAELAEWNDLKDFFSNDESALISFLDGIGMKRDVNGYVQSAFVTRGGDRYHSTSMPRHYYVNRFDGDVPSGWLVHDDLHSNRLSLGSWDNDREAMVRVPESEEAGSSTVEGETIKPNGEALPGMNVTFSGDSQNYSLTTDENGEFSQEVEHGTYEITGNAIEGTTYLSVNGQQTSVSVEEGQTASITLDTENGYYLDLHDVTLDGEQGTVTASPGESIDLSFDYTAWSRSELSTAVVYAAAGIEEEGQAAADLGIPGSNPGDDGTAGVTLTAPSETGTYSVYVFEAPQTSEGDALSQYENEFPNEYKYIPVATLEVTN
jgi:hypothetical protein